MSARRPLEARGRWTAARESYEARYREKSRELDALEKRSQTGQKDQEFNKAVKDFLRDAPKLGSQAVGSPGDKAKSAIGQARHEANVFSKFDSKQDANSENFFGESKRDTLRRELNKIQKDIAISRQQEARYQSAIDYYGDWIDGIQQQQRRDEWVAWAARTRAANNAQAPASTGSSQAPSREGGDAPRSGGERATGRSTDRTDRSGPRGTVSVGEGRFGSRPK